eukprot:GGOE01041955.1.p3 GENE.GGOE01041955.1~~GGOE01041955.1.p3  ORF type:complete len:160 (-),score=35.93 GGOE01041955.1:143-622(-)
MARHILPVLHGLSTQSVYKWGKNHSPWPGLSGLFYLLPILPVYLQGRFWEVAIWLLQALATVLSDGFYSGQPSVWHPVDRFIATWGTLYNATKVVWLCNCGAPCRLWCALCIPPVLWCFYCSKTAPDFPTYVFYHTCWHVIGGITVAIAAVLEDPVCSF